MSHIHNCSTTKAARQQSSCCALATNTGNITLRILVVNAYASVDFTLARRIKEVNSDLILLEIVYCLLNTILKILFQCIVSDMGRKWRLSQRNQLVAW